MNEITALDVEKGSVDIQGIAWTNSPVSRADFRSNRILRYGNFANFDHDFDSLKSQHSTVEEGNLFYRFRYAKLKCRCSIVHFQLRNLLWALSRNDLFYPHDSTIRHWSPGQRNASTLVDLHNSEVDTVKLTSMAVKYNVLLAGGLGGQYVIQRLEPVEPGVDEKIRSPAKFASPPLLGRITLDPNGITNHVEVYASLSGPLTGFISSNDSKLRLINLETTQIVRSLPFDFPLNCTSLSPDRRLICAVGDSKESLVVDASTGNTVLSLGGHSDYSFACAWSPFEKGTTGFLLATGNQDKTARVYDIRFSRDAVAVLPAKMAAIRSLRFSPDGQLLAMAEPADFVHLFDLQAGLHPSLRSQVIDFFGEISGITFAGSSDELSSSSAFAQQTASDSFFICNADDKYGGIFEFERLRSSKTLFQLSDFHRQEIHL